MHRNPPIRFAARKGKRDIPLSPDVRPGGARRLERIERAKAKALKESKGNA